MSISRSSPQRPKARIPKIWAIGIGVALLAYTFLQPWLSQQLGWQLPSLLDDGRPGMTAGDPVEGAANAVTVPATNQPARQEAGQVSAPSVEAPELLYGLLRETEPEEYLSPAGLLYTPGSEQGHRLKHLERHLQDDPTRPGKHGVFYGDMPQLLRWLDQAFLMAKQGVAGTSDRRESDARTVYEVKFPKPVGYVGGRDGKRDNHPDAYQIRLVVEGNRVITAFPF